MHKRSRKQNQEPDENEMAARVVAEATEAGGTSPFTEEEEARAWAKYLGSKGGKKGGPARRDKLSPARRKEIAQKAARARWKDHEKKTRRKKRKKGRTPPSTDTTTKENSADA